MVAHQREATAGKLHPDLVAAACVKADADETPVIGSGKAGKLQPRFFNAPAFPFYHENLVFTAVFP